MKQNDEYTLKDVIKILGISRRAIQGYQNKGLITVCKKNKYGYLLFDESTLNRIAFIRFCQLFSFSLAEIQSFIDEPANVILDYFLARQQLIERQKMKMDVLHDFAENYISLLPNSTELNHFFDNASFFRKEKKDEKEK